MQNSIPCDIVKRNKYRYITCSKYSIKFNSISEKKIQNDFSKKKNPKPRVLLNYRCCLYNQHFRFRLWNSIYDNQLLTAYCQLLTAEMFCACAVNVIYLTSNMKYQIHCLKGPHSDFTWKKNAGRMCKKICRTANLATTGT